MTKRSTARDPAVARTDLLDSPLTVENQFDDVSDMLSPEQLLWAILYCASGEKGAYRDYVPRWAWSLNKRCCPNLDCLRTAFDRYKASSSRKLLNDLITP